MKDFMTAMQQENNKRKTLTENGAVAYETAGKHILDFNFRLGAFRSMSMEEVMREFKKVYFEDPKTAIKYLFYAGDIREGVGERNAFRSGLVWLAENEPDVCKEIIKYVGEYNRFDSLLPLIDTGLREYVCSYIKDVLENDMEQLMNGGHPSLLAKWLPSINASSKKTRRYGNIIRNCLELTPRQYRKTLSKLRSYINVVEIKMSANRWDEINYETVPSKANLIYNPAFLRHDEERRRAYLDSLKKGEVKINAGVLQPHEIVAKYINRSGWWGTDIKDYDETLEQLWNNLPDMTIENTLVVRDGSGSMESPISGRTTCLDVATALTVYMAERNNGGWKDKFITFSARPSVIDISNCKTLRDKLDYIYGEDDCSNTDIYKTMMLILNTAINNHMTQDDMPGMTVICSDMQFDGRRFNLNKTLFEEIIEEYEAAGYKMPRICFWNISDRGNKTVPIQQNDLGLILCSGFSVQIMKMFMSNKLDPYEILMEQVNSPRYDAIDDAVSNLV